MAYGTTKVDTIQSSTANTPVVFKDGSGTQIGTLCRAWVNFNGTGTVAIRGSFNVSSITDNGTGDYTVNFTTAMPDANYSSLITAQGAAGSGGSQWVGMLYQPTGGIYSTTQTRFLTGNSANGVAADSPITCVAIFR